jgi:hypothetical protein
MVAVDLTPLLAETVSVAVIATLAYSDSRRLYGIRLSVTSDCRGRERTVI